MAQVADLERRTFAATTAASIVAIGIWSLAMLWFSVVSGRRHDYNAYLSQWKLVLSGANPWSTDNAYGPLHNLLAYMLSFGALGPKLFIVTAFLAANTLLVAELLRTARAPADYVLYLLAVPTNLVVIYVGSAYGLNDALVAAFVACAIVARCRRQMEVAGCLLGLAVLLKYYPVFLVPMFALDKGRLRWSLILSAVSVMLLGIASAMLIWGNAFLTALTYGAGREPKLLSILYALTSYPPLIGGPDVLAFLIRNNSVFVVLVNALLFLAAWRMRLHWLEASVLSLLLTLATYKVGHQQFYITWLILVAALPLASSDSARRLAWLCLPYILFLDVFQWDYAIGYSSQFSASEGPTWVRRYVGFLVFPFSLAIATAYLSTRRRRLV
jgi:hypothetical protein